MPNTATKRDKNHSKAGRSPSVPTTTTKGKINTPERAEAPKSRKTNTNPKPQPLKGGRRTPQGGQKSSAKKLTPITTTKTNGDSPGPRTPIKKTPTPTAKPETPQAGQKPQGAQKGNTSNSNQQQRTIASHSHQEEERHNRGAKHPNKKQNRHVNVGRSPRALKDKHRPQTTATQGRRRTPQGGQKPHSAKKANTNLHQQQEQRQRGQAEVPERHTHQPTEKEGNKEERKERKKEKKERKRKKKKEKEKRRIKNCTAWQQKTQSDLTPRADKPQSAKHNTKHQHKPQSG